MAAPLRSLDAEAWTPAKELYEILSAGGGELGALACSPPARAGNPLPRDCAFQQHAHAYAPRAATPAADRSPAAAHAAFKPAAAAPAKVKVVGFQPSTSLLSRSLA